MDNFKLTELAHGGGCGCKLSPAVLRELLASTPIAGTFPQLLVGNETADDAAVWQLPDGNCAIATTDFFMPVVDDPRDFGRIAATNAVSDIYAMGGTPLFALAILGMPLGKLPIDITREILAGGAQACAGVGIPVVGGHSIDTAEPIYGLAVFGTCTREQLRRNCDAVAGDHLILTKPIGVGIYANALRKDALSKDGYTELIAATTQPNIIGAKLGHHAPVHAMTDVTGFGILGHALEMARGSKVSLRLDANAIPTLSQAKTLVQDGYVTGASHRNWDSYADGVRDGAAIPEYVRHLLTDAQTSGGLLISCDAKNSADVLTSIKAAGFTRAAIIGAVEAGPAQVSVEGY
jgi:selenide,water dikinase